MSRQADVYSIPSFLVTIATNSAVKIGPFPGQLAASIKLISGGTLEIGAWGASLPSSALTQISGLTGTFAVGTSQTPGSMYPMSTNEVFSVNNSGVVVLYASGATCVVAIASGRSGE
jgi:hypothetical protein